MSLNPTASPFDNLAAYHIDLQPKSISATGLHMLWGEGTLFGKAAVIGMTPLRMLNLTLVNPFTGDKLTRGFSLAQRVAQEGSNEYLTKLSNKGFSADEMAVLVEKLGGYEHVEGMKLVCEAYDELSNQFGAFIDAKYALLNADVTSFYDEDGKMHTDGKAVAEEIAKHSYHYGLSFTEIVSKSFSIMSDAGYENRVFEYFSALMGIIQHHADELTSLHKPYISIVSLNYCKDVLFFCPQFANLFVNIFLACYLTGPLVSCFNHLYENGSLLKAMNEGFFGFYTKASNSHKLPYRFIFHAFIENAAIMVPWAVLNSYGYSTHKLLYIWLELAVRLLPMIEEKGFDLLTQGRLMQVMATVFGAIVVGFTRGVIKDNLKGDIGSEHIALLYDGFMSWVSAALVAWMFPVMQWATINTAVSQKQKVD